MTNCQKETVEIIRKYVTDQFNSSEVNRESKKLIFDVRDVDRSDLVFVSIKSKTINNSMLFLTDKCYHVAIGKRGGIFGASNIGEVKDEKTRLKKVFRAAKSGRYYYYLSL